jgi:hypothetical protein
MTRALTGGKHAAARFQSSIAAPAMMRKHAPAASLNQSRE